MDFIAALLEVLIPSRAAKAEMESLRLGLVRLAASHPVVTGRPAGTDVSEALGGPATAPIRV
jgi:hypothetical protein